VAKIENIICEGEICLKLNNSCAVKDVVKYGLWLNKLCKIKKGGFQRFVQVKLKYSPRWIRKVRQMSRLVTKYRKLQNLDIFVTEAITITPAIEKAFIQYPAQEIKWS
jgi:hypothetical protein